METLELFTPRLIVRIGPYEFTEGVGIEVSSAQDAYFDWAKVYFTAEYQPKLSLARKEPASIALGYGDTFEEVFRGYVAKHYNAADAAHVVSLIDDMLLLQETQINNTFLETTPQEAISYILGQADVTGMELSPQLYPERRQFPIRKTSALQAINAVHAAWGIKLPFFFSSGIFHWGTKPTQDKIYAFEYGMNILSLIRVGGLWELETVSAPFIRHSQRIEVYHPLINGIFEVVKVLSNTNGDGFIRTRVYF